VAECKVVRAGEAVSGTQGLLYAHGISSETAASRGLCMHRLTIPAGRYGLAHLHEGHESAIFVLEGEAEFWWGERLEHHEVCRAGDFVYIPAGVPHLPANLTAEPCEAVVARTDPGDQESVALRPDLDALVHAPDV
jgi:uncharacterized RmlC-like cupin family protein